jgi:hypothetical protein
MAPIITTSISHATKRSHQKASFGSDAAGATGAIDSGDASSAVTEVPHTVQYFASSGIAAPHFLQEGISNPRFSNTAYNYFFFSGSLFPEKHHYLPNLQFRNIFSIRNRCQ